jgi:glycosyltransferase involved in cell wall biosynthesis/SAM-dependent methyltransferase
MDKKDMNNIPKKMTDVQNLRNKISFLDKILPEIVYHNRSNGEIDFYGASYLICSQLGLKKPLYSRSTWKHGWLWYDVISPIRLVESGNKHVHNLVFTKNHELYLKEHGYSQAIAVGAPFIYAKSSFVERKSGSILVMPPHSTLFGTFDAKSDLLPYINHIKILKKHFSLVVGCVGGQDVIKNNWVKAFETAEIPWITGGWSFDSNALQRMRNIFDTFEYVTSNHPGSHFAYAAYCGCKVSFWGKDLERKKRDLTTHPFYEKNPDIAEKMKKIDYEDEFSKRYPFFFVDPWDANVQFEWAKQALGEDNKKPPEVIAELFEWKLRKLPSGRWAPINKHDALTNDEIFAKATAKSIVGQHTEAFKLTNILKRRHVRLKDVEIIRARYFLSIKNTHGAREALKEELRHFPDNVQASRLLQELGGNDRPHVAQKEDEKEFVAFYNAVRPFTRLNIKRAKSLYDLAMRACQENIPGNFVECGVAAGGSTMLLALVVQKHSRIPRKVFAFDTFTGMPDPEDVDTAKGVPADETGWGAGTCAAPEDFVIAQCKRIGVDHIVQTRKGLFEDTLPTHRGEIGEIALLHMDADWYSSTMTILDNLFDQLHDNALIQIDDYGAWDGCKKAILDYSARHDLFFDIHEIDGTGVWCAKPTQVKKKTATKSLSSQDTAFLEPQLSSEFVDLYIVRKAIKDSIAQSILLFNGTFLDVGCGQMPYKEFILNANPNIKKYIGLDFAQGKYADLKQPDITWDGKTIPLEDASVDCAMATEVLEHCPEPLVVLKEIRRVLKPNAVFFFTVPFLWPLHDTPHDYYRYTPFFLERLLKEAGFEDIQIKAMGGWNAALAQMIGLWLRRAPMAGEARTQLTKDLYPFFTELIRTDAIPTDFLKNPMITGLSGTAKSAAPRVGKLPKADSQRVIVVTDQFPVLSQTFILDQVTGLMDRGLTMEHWSMERMDESVVHENVRKYALLESTRFITLPPDALRVDPKRWTEQFLHVNNLSAMDDLTSFHIHFGPNFNKLAPLFAAYPDMFVMVSFHGYDGSATFKVKGADVYKGLFARANRITTPSKYMKHILAQQGCPPDKIVVHHYGKDIVAFAPTLRKEGRGPVRLLSVARFVEKKGLEYSISAFAKAQAGLNVEYRIIGYGPLEQKLIALAKMHGVEDKVRFLGQLTNDAVRQEMANADIFVLTSVTAKNGDQEGVPVSLIEAQALGLPVVSSVHAGIPELVTHDATGFLAEERNIDEIAGYMRVLIKNPDIRKTFSANARAKVLHEFDLAKLNDKLADHLTRKGQEDASPWNTGNNVAQTVTRGESPHEKERDKAAAGEAYCPVCRSRHTSFRAFGKPQRPDALCPGCNSLERHRALWLFLERYTDFFSSSRLRLLHFAPEACFEPRFRQLVGKGYVTVDLLDPRADVRADITNLQFPDASFDVLLCSHVLEHVPDDRKAMQELYRVLDKNGIAIIMVPLRGKITQEDLSITDPEERTRRYGQADHVRYYGMDIVERLQGAGFIVRHVDTDAVFSSDDFSLTKLSKEKIFLCRKESNSESESKDHGTQQGGGEGKSNQLAEQTLTKIAKHWSTTKTAPRTRWWMHPAVLRHVNTLVCGKPMEGPWTGLEQRMSKISEGRGFDRGLSIGCGSASKELSLLRNGIVGKFDLFEISEQRVANGKAAATRCGVAARANFRVENAFSQNLDDQYDLVYWNNALHHVFDVRAALEWSRKRLIPGGSLVVDDYVGPTRFQWPEEQLRIATKVRKALPDRLLRSPFLNNQRISFTVGRPSVESMLSSDPSEAADSGNILPALRAVFPLVEIIMTGGVVYHLALNDVIANFDDTQDAELLRTLLDFDAALATNGHTHYACAFAFN